MGRGGLWALVDEVNEYFTKLMVHEKGMLYIWQLDIQGFPSFEDFSMRWYESLLFQYRMLRLPTTLILVGQFIVFSLSPFLERHSADT